MLFLLPYLEVTITSGKLCLNKVLDGYVPILLMNLLMQCLVTFLDYWNMLS